MKFTITISDTYGDAQILTVKCGDRTWCVWLNGGDALCQQCRQGRSCPHARAVKRWANKLTAAKGDR